MTEYFRDIDQRKAARYASIISAGRDDIIYFAEKILGIQLHDGQKKWLRESLRKENGQYVYKFTYLCPSNQWGKTLIEAGVVKTHQAFYKTQLTGYSEEAKFIAEYQQLYASPHSQQLDRAYNYMTKIIAGEFVWEENGKRCGPNKSLIPWAIVRKTTEPYYVKWYHGAETFFRPTGEDQGASISASPYTDITYDEACRSYHLNHEINGILIMRATRYGAQIRIPSTPWFKSPSFMFFKEEFEKGMITKRHPYRDPLYYSQTGNLYDNDFLPEEEKKKAEALTDPELRRQTIYGEFVGTFNTYFDDKAIDMLFSNKLLQFEAGDNIGTYIVLWDPAFGANDNSVFHVYRRDGSNFRLVRRECFRGNTLSPESQFALARQLYNEYNKADFAFDGSGPQGKLIFSKLQNIDPISINFAQEKGAVLVTLKDFLSYGRKTVRDKSGVISDTVSNFGRIRAPFVEQIAKELGAYPGPDNDKKAQCDDVVAMALLAWFVDKVSAPMESYDFDILAQGGELNKIHSL